MAEERYFVYVGESTYTKLSADKGMYVFKDGEPVKVTNQSDQRKFAGNPLFVETDASGKTLSFADGALAANNPSEDSAPLSYTKLEAKGAAKAAPEASEEEVEEEKPKKSKKKSKKKEEEKDE